MPYSPLPTVYTAARSSPVEVSLSVAKISPYLACQHCPLPTTTAPTDSKVALAVANEGLRPQVPSHAPPVAAQMIESCWQQDPQLRPSFEQARHSGYSRSTA